MGEREEEVAFRWVEGKSDGFQDAASVRIQVFVDEQGYDGAFEIDDTDAAARHIIGYFSGAPVCTARVFQKKPGTQWVIGRVAVLPQMRGRGTGLCMMQQAIEKIRRQGAESIFISAQQAKSGFYEHLGFVCTGKTTLDEGQPHVDMLLRL